MKRKKMPIIGIQVLCVAGGFLLYMLAALLGGDGTLLSMPDLKRAPHGQGDIKYEILVNGLEDVDEVPIEIVLAERQYSEKEAADLYEQIWPEIILQVLGDNDSLENVHSDLNLIGGMSEYGVKLEWVSENPELIDSFGIVCLDGLDEEGRETNLKAYLTDGNYRQEYNLRVKVLPQQLTQQERAVNRFKEWVGKQDAKQQPGTQLILPHTYEGKPFSYRLNDGADYRVIPLLGILLAVLWPARNRINEQKQKKRREQLLLLDYSEVVSKLMVFIGAGMTVRVAWEQIVSGYESALERGYRSVRPVYEEMQRTVYQLHSGMPESKAYGEFGCRCGLQPYLKLAALLEQNRKAGTKNLRQTLELELVSAFEQRKNLAKRLGEEAGTKLLIPLFLMLGIVMIIIVIPAFLSFY